MGKPLVHISGDGVTSIQQVKSGIYSFLKLPADSPNAGYGGVIISDLDTEPFSYQIVLSDNPNNRTFSYRYRWYNSNKWKDWEKIQLVKG